MTWINFEEVRRQLDFEEVLAHFGFDVQQSGGDQVKIHCPFHDDAKPSCGVHFGKKVFHCFSCQVKGNVLDFVTRMEGFDPGNPRDLRKAAIQACEVFGLDGGSREEVSNQPKAKAKPEVRRAKAEVKVPPSEKKVESSVSAASSGGAEQVPNPPLTFTLQLDRDHPVINERGVARELVEIFGLGFAGKGSMKGRLCFPIHNVAGELIAYSGRWVDGDLPEGAARYLLPKGFEKRLVLYNLHRVLAARERLVSAEKLVGDTVVIAEGFWSVIRLHGAGVPAVSTFGGTISKEQVELLVRAGFARAVLIYDGDAGGRAGTEQALPLLTERLFTKVVRLEDSVKPDTMSEELVKSLPRF